MAKPRYGRFEQCQILFQDRGLSLTRCNMPHSAQTVLTVRDAQGGTVGRAVVETDMRQTRAARKAWPKNIPAKHQRVLKASFIEIAPDARKARIGTLLYDAMLGEACDRGLPLTSDTFRSHFAEAFWQKQVAKGRAKCVKKKNAYGDVYTKPLRELNDAVARGAMTRAAYEKTVANLPKPELKPGHRDWAPPDMSRDAVWSCNRYDIDNACDIATLAGVKKRRKTHRKG